MSDGLKEAFLDELRDAYDAEKQLLKALPKMAKKATNGQLRAAFLSHRAETQEQVALLDQLFAAAGEKARGKHCDGIAGIIEEGKSVMEEDFDAQTMDACLIASGQRAEHYEIAAYGTLVSWGRVLGNDEAVALLSEILEQEKATDEKLTALADGDINEAAARDGDAEGGETEDAQVETPSPRRRSAAKKSSKKTRR